MRFCPKPPEGNSTADETCYRARLFEGLIVDPLGDESTCPGSSPLVRHATVKGSENELRHTVQSDSQADEHRPVKLLSPVLPLDRALHTDGYPERDRVGASFSEHR
jgi:hypothetical protein